MQSHNYVPGVSGWKLHHDGHIELNDSPQGSVRIGSRSSLDQEQPFVVEDRQLKLSRAQIDDAVAECAKFVDVSRFQIKLSLSQSGDAYVTGVGIDPNSVASERAEELDHRIRAVLEAELRPGGILRRALK